MPAGVLQSANAVLAVAVGLSGGDWLTRLERCPGEHYVSRRTHSLVDRI
jgi:hypothetical protein